MILALLKSVFDGKVKLLYSDNECDNVNLQGLLQKYGISLEYYGPYTSQQNGVAERLNRALMENVRTMLIQSGFTGRMA